MAIQFCSDCGDTLPISTEKTVVCECCGKTSKNKLLTQKSTSSTSNFPSALRTKLTSNTQTLSTKDMQGFQQRSSDKCPNCSKDGLTFSQAQLRSADEGTTIFYHCLSCDHRFVENN